MTAPVLQPRGLTQLLDLAFRLYRQNFVLFLGIVAIPLVPFILAEGAVEAHFVSQFAAKPDPNDTEAFYKWVEEEGSAQMNYAMINMLIALAGWSVVRPIATGALTYAVSERYLEREATVGGAYRRIFSLLGRYFGAIVAAGLVTMLPMMAFLGCTAVLGAAAGTEAMSLVLVPLGGVAAVLTIVFVLWFMFVSQVVVLERTKATESLRRSRSLAKGNMWRLIRMGALLALITMVITYSATLALGLLVPYITSSNAAQTVLTTIGQGVVNVLLGPLFAAAWILLYYDIRIRREGFDLEVLASNLAGASSEPGNAAAVLAPEE